MKKTFQILPCAILATAMLSVSSCTEDNKQTTAEVRVPLQIEVASVQNTRVAIDGTIMPNGSVYGIFAMYGGGTEKAVENGINTLVFYEGGMSELSSTIYIPKDVDVPVYAYYPYNEHYDVLDYLRRISVESASQTDYLYGTSVDANNNFSFANINNPKVRIHFRHILARIRLNIHKAENNANYYKLPYVSLKNVLSEGLFDLYEGELLQSEGTANLSTQPTEYTLDTPEDMLTVDFLVLPMNTATQTVLLSMGSNPDDQTLEIPMPATTWKSGQQYTYDVTIEEGSLIVKESEITPWTNSDQNGIVVGDNNYVEQ